VCTTNRVYVISSTRYSKPRRCSTDSSFLHVEISANRSSLKKTDRSFQSECGSSSVTPLSTLRWLGGHSHHRRCCRRNRVIRTRHLFRSQSDSEHEIVRVLRYSTTATTVRSALFLAHVCVCVCVCLFLEVLEKETMLCLCTSWQTCTTNCNAAVRAVGLFGTFGPIPANVRPMTLGHVCYIIKTSCVRSFSVGVYHKFDNKN
jgi:hypothetical protein